jgi:hypothetical protein
MLLMGREVGLINAGLQSYSALAALRRSAPVHINSGGEKILVAIAT